MNRIHLMTAVAALAITAPVQAEKGGKRGEQTPEQAQQAQAEKAQRGGGEQRVRAERPEREQRVLMERPQREERVRMERPQRDERVRMERPQREERVRMERPQREERVRMERPQREQRVRMERPQREERVRMERPQREQRVRMDRPQREQRVRQQQQRPERLARQNRVERQARLEDFRGRQSEQRTQMGDRSFKQQLKQQRQAERFEQKQQRFEQRSAQFDNRATQRALFDNSRRERWSSRPQVSVGERLNVRNYDDYTPVDRDWYGDYAAQRYRAQYSNTPDYSYDYNYNDGYLYQADRSGFVTGLFPLLGGAFGVGQIMPSGYSSYNVPYGYRSLYYDTPDYDYRYGDGAIYRVDSNTQMIQAVVALLTGQSFGVGQALPMGYDVYNVPYAYRSQYADSNDMWYRYDDGYIYGVDPYSRMIENVYPVSYGNYAVGYPAPTYASYGANYAVPYGYDDLYYSQPGYNYQYANGGIYQVDPTTQLVSALVALVTGQNLGVGQQLPSGYDAYNVPQAYRASYYDTPNTMYRYDDGVIYGANRNSRLIETAIPVAYNGFAVGYPVPATYPGYAVPQLYSDLYYPQPGFDYRYADGGIYQIDPQTRMVEAIAALLTGQTFGVGQMMPAGYDAYNVPYAYRDQYADSADNMYRYADGNIYQVDPRTRVIGTVITIA